MDIVDAFGDDMRSETGVVNTTAEDNELAQFLTEFFTEPSTQQQEDLSHEQAVAFGARAFESGRIYQSQFEHAGTVSVSMTPQLAASFLEYLGDQLS